MSVTNQEGQPIITPQSSVEIDIPTDPKKDFGCTIKVYGPDGQADYDLAFKLATDFVSRRADLKAGVYRRTPEGVDPDESAGGIFPI